jgi:hypothetical protein
VFKTQPDSVGLTRTRDALIDRLAPGESFLRSVPVGNGFLPHLPAQQEDLAFNFAGKVEQANIDILDLHANGIDLGQRILGALPFRKIR